MNEALGIETADIGLQGPLGSTVLDEVQAMTTSPARHLLIPLRNEDVLDWVFANKERITQELVSTESHNSGVYVFTAVQRGLWRHIYGIMRGRWSQRKCVSLGLLRSRSCRG